MGKSNAKRHERNSKASGRGSSSYCSAAHRANDEYAKFYELNCINQVGKGRRREKEREEEGREGDTYTNCGQSKWQKQKL